MTNEKNISVSSTKKVINALAPKSLKDALVRSVKLFFYVFIPLIPANNIIAGADPAVFKTAAVAGISAVFALIANTIFNWASDYER